MTSPTEQRITPGGLRVERRSGADGRQAPHIVGHAAVFDQWTTLYEGRYWTWREVVRPGAFDAALSERQDVVSVFNHDDHFILGRSSAGTLTLRADAIGLLTDTAAADSQRNREYVLDPIDRGELRGMSFRFAVRNQGGSTTVERSEDGKRTVITRPGERITLTVEDDREIEERELLALDLRDVSVVTWPAYAGTDLAVRSLGIDPARREAEIEQRIRDRFERRRMRDRLYVQMRLTGVGRHRFTGA